MNKSVYMAMCMRADVRVKAPRVTRSLVTPGTLGSGHRQEEGGFAHCTMPTLRHMVGMRVLGLRCVVAVAV